VLVCFILMCISFLLIICKRKKIMQVHREFQKVIERRKIFYFGLLQST